ncbi:MAG: alkaline phosphatase family protein [Geminicoccaceae bacterium]|nr:alkaline phosphatase family protein [Geminicoccaceae bacterium]
MTQPRTDQRVLMLGLDAAELTLIERWIAEGRLPALAELARRGRFGPLTSPAADYAGGVWPTFYASRPVARHGIYHNKLWRASTMRIEVPTDAWLGSRPFWEHAAARGLRACIVDVPMVLGPPRPLDGLYLGGWGTHDVIARGSWPPELWRELENRHGAPAMPPEHFGPQDAASLTRLRDSLLDATAQQQQIVLDLLGREQWDLACVVLGATHRGGHYLWDLGEIDQAPLDAARRTALEGALAELYVAVDRTVGEIVARVDDATTVLAFAVHGMGPNPGWADLFADILDAALQAADNRPPKRGLLYSLKRRIPFHWARPILTRLPPAVTGRLVELWSSGMYDWRTTRHFPLAMDHAGYLRLNVAGRERDGIVEPGAAYTALCDRLEGLILALRDAGSGAALAAAVHRAWQEAPATADGRDVLPDLVVTWAGLPARQVRRVVCDQVPGFAYDVPQRLPSGRSGNHRDRGWLIAAGPGIAPGALEPGHSILDLVPTVMARLGVEADPAWDGRPIDLSPGPALP